jgi:hypothetical protein
MHCVDESGCQASRDQAVPQWIDNQFRSWSIDWDRYRQALAAQEQYRGGIYAPGFKPYYLTAGDDELTTLELAALADVRDMVDRRAREWLEPELRLSADVPGPAAPQAPKRLCTGGGCDHKTLRCPDNRTHLLGHHRQHPSVHDAASALARKAVLARSG